MDARRIRPIALGIIRRDGHLLVQHGMNVETGGQFFRPPGGAIEFGERAVDALRREFIEELQAELDDVQLLTVLENPFSYNGSDYHEIVFVFEARFTDVRLYRLEEFTIRETSTRAAASWKRIDALGGIDAPLYPTGLLQILQQAVGDTA